MHLYRHIDIEVDTASWGSRQCPSSLKQLGAGYPVNLLSMLVYTALCTAPPAGYGFEPGYYWAWLRYLPAFANTHDLRLRREWDDLDPRQKAILSDEVGMGLTSGIVCEQMRLYPRPFPTSFVLNWVTRHGSRWIRYRGRSRRGPAKSPDFVGVEWRSGYPTVHVWESKGTQTASNLDMQIRSGRPQKLNITIQDSRAAGERLVIGIFIPRWSEKRRAKCTIVDPPVEGNGEQTEVGRDELVRMATEADASTWLHFLGWHREANAVLEWLAGHDTEAVRATMVMLNRALGIEEYHGNSFLSSHRDYTFPKPYPRSPAPDAQPALGLVDEPPSINGLRVTVGIDRVIAEALTGRSLRKAMERLYQRTLDVEGIRKSENDGSGYTLVTPAGLLLRVEAL